MTVTGRVLDPEGKPVKGRAGRPGGDTHVRRGWLDVDDEHSPLARPGRDRRRRAIPLRAAAYLVIRICSRYRSWRPRRASASAGPS